MTENEQDSVFKFLCDQLNDCHIYKEDRADLPLVLAKMSLALKVAELIRDYSIQKEEESK